MQIHEEHTSSRTAERSECRSSSQKQRPKSSFSSYLSELSNLASNMRHLTEETINLMTRSNMLLGSRRVKKDGSEASSEEGKDELLQPKEVVIVDDIRAYQVFGDRIFCAPQRDILEGTYSSGFDHSCTTHLFLELYLFLGSPCLSSLVRKEYRISGEVPNSTIGAEIRHLILEPSPSFPSRTFWVQHH